jgi:hypothetical protein
MPNAPIIVPITASGDAAKPAAPPPETQKPADKPSGK